LTGQSGGPGAAALYWRLCRKKPCIRNHLRKRCPKVTAGADRRYGRAFSVPFRKLVEVFDRKMIPVSYPLYKMSILVIS